MKFAFFFLYQIPFEYHYGFINIRVVSIVADKTPCRGRNMLIFNASMAHEIKRVFRTIVFFNLGFFFYHNARWCEIVI